MEPAFFGAAEDLFGIYHPSNRSPSQFGVLIPCGLPGEERLTWLYKSLAQQLSNRGFDVLRFDLPGCGNSHGNIEDVSLDIWQESIRTIHLELTDIAAVREVAVVAFRFAAALGVAALHEKARHVSIDPFFGGQDYLNDLEKKRHLTMISAVDPDAIGSFEYLGHLFSEELLSSLAEFKVEISPECDVTVVCSEGSAANEACEQKFADSLRWDEVDVPIIHAHAAVASLSDILVDKFR